MKISSVEIPDMMRSVFIEFTRAQNIKETPVSIALFFAGAAAAVDAMRGDQRTVKTLACISVDALRLRP